MSDRKTLLDSRANVCSLFRENDNQLYTSCHWIRTRTWLHLTRNNGRVPTAGQPTHMQAVVTRGRDACGTQSQACSASTWFNATREGHLQGASTHGTASWRQNSRLAPSDARREAGHSRCSAHHAADVTIRFSKFSAGNENSARHQQSFERTRSQETLFLRLTKLKGKRTAESTTD
jgi:hypothetical protein